MTQAASHIIAAVERAEVTDTRRVADNLPEEPTIGTDQVIVLTAGMVNGTLITEEVVGFAAFTAMVLSFRRDPDVVKLTWVLDASAVRQAP